MIKKLLVAAIAARGGAFGMLAAGALGVLAAATIALPSASAEPECTAAGLSSTLGPVATATGDYLASHPDLNQVLTSAGSLPGDEAEKSIKIFFATHPQQWIDLRAIGRPLADLRQQCPVQAAGPSPDIGKLYDAMAK
jgi:hemophore-related protein